MLFKYIWPNWSCYFLSMQKLIVVSRQFWLYMPVMRTQQSADCYWLIARSLNSYISYLPSNILTCGGGTNTNTAPYYTPSSYAPATAAPNYPLANYLYSL